MNLELHLIINTHAGSGHGQKVTNLIMTALKEKNITCHPYYTAYQGHGIELTEQLLATTLRTWPDTNKEGPYPLLVVIGGDGTLHEVVNTLAAHPTIPIGYLPGGSGNDFARGSFLSHDPLIALDHLLAQTEPQFFNLLTYHDDPGQMVGLFTNNMGIGIDAAIVASAHASASKKTLNKFNIGFLTYFVSMFRVLFNHPGFPLTIHLNNDSYTFKNAFLCTITNHPYFGGGVAIVPTADIRQPNLDIVIVERVNLFKIIYLISLILRKKHLGNKHIHHFTTTELAISSPTSQAIHADGEVISPQSVELVIKSTRRLFWL